MTGDQLRATWQLDFLEDLPAPSGSISAAIRAILCGIYPIVMLPATILYMAGLATNRAIMGGATALWARLDGWTTSRTELSAPAVGTLAVIGSIRKAIKIAGTLRNVIMLSGSLQEES